MVAEAKREFEIHEDKCVWEVDKCIELPCGCKVFIRLTPRKVHSHTDVEYRLHDTDPLISVTTNGKLKYLLMVTPRQYLEMQALNDKCWDKGDPSFDEDAWYAGLSKILGRRVKPDAYELVVRDW
jgi:hypothetical protein